MSKATPNPSQHTKPHQTLSSVGYPVHVFIDTGYFEKTNFAFGGKTLSAVISAVVAGDMRLVMPQITRREVLGRLKKGVEAAQDAHAKFRRDSGILRGLPNHCLGKKIDKPDWAGTLESLEKGWVRFLKKSKAILLPIESGDAPTVFDDYFQCLPPFDSGEKKNEFPDAFAIYSLLAFAKANHHKVVVVSTDGDFERACTRFGNLVFAQSLDAVLEHAIRSGQLNPAEVHTLLEPHLGVLESDIIKSFKDRGFFWDSDEYDSYVDDTFDEEITEPLDLSVVKVGGGWADVTGEATLSFRASATFPDPEMSIWDSESGTAFSFEKKRATVAASLVVPISLRLNLKSLRKGKLAYKELSVNNGSDVYFHEDEIEEVSELESEDPSE